MTGTWTDPELDAALRDLGVAVDADAARTDPAGAEASLAAVRARLVGATTISDPAAADVLDIGPARDARADRPARRRWAPALLVAAAVVAAVTLAAVFWPREARRTPPAQPTPTVTRSVEQQLALLAEPLPPVGSGSYTVIVTTSGVGDGTVAFTPLASATDPVGNPIALSYNVVCGSPEVAPTDAEGGPADPRLAYSVADNLGAVGSSQCAGIAGGVSSRSSGSYSPSPPTGRNRVTIDVAGDDVVWKLTVTAASVA